MVLRLGGKGLSASVRNNPDRMCQDVGLDKAWKRNSTKLVLQVLVAMCPLYDW